jgi:SAM-dependent methyltransferase
VTSIEPSAGFRTTAKANLGERAVVLPGDASALPAEDASVDVVVSALVLNFVPDPIAALTEMARVTRPGGTVAAYVWDYAGKMELIRYFWDVAVELDSAATALDEALRFPSCNAVALRERFTSSLFESPEVTAIEIATPFASFEAYWQPFLGGQGPAPAYAMSLSEGERRRLHDRLRTRIPTHADGSISLTARAWAVRARVAN